MVEKAHGFSLTLRRSRWPLGSGSALRLTARRSASAAARRRRLQQAVPPRAPGQVVQQVVDGVLRHRPEAVERHLQQCLRWAPLRPRPHDTRVGHLWRQRASREPEDPAGDDRKRCATVDIILQRAASWQCHQPARTGARPRQMLKPLLGNHRTCQPACPAARPFLCATARRRAPEPGAASRAAVGRLPRP